MEDELDPKEAARTRRRDRDAAAQARALLRPGMGKVFKQIQDVQARAAADAKRRSPRSRGPVASSPRPSPESGPATSSSAPSPTDDPTDRA
jgi:hypothetical protein